MEEALRYRDLAARFEREAFASTLPRVRELKLNAARQWEALAEEQEMVLHWGPYSTRSNRSDWIF